jgi:hypothetical protein
MAISTTIPTYRQLNDKGFFSPQADLIPEGVAFEFDGEPNAQMEALNEPAKKKLEAFYKKLAICTKELAEKNGRTSVGVTHDVDVLIAEATADARRVELRKGDGGIPLMGGVGKEKVKTVTLPEGGQPILRLNKQKD